MTEAEISDPSDWISTRLPTFSPLESALRCQVCKDFYRIPVITSCSHTFCSICIRRSLSADGKCPICRVDDQASKLRRNLVIEEVVARFKEARPVALALAAPVADIEEDIVASQKPRKRRKIEDTTAGEANATGRQTRSSSRRQAVSQSDSVDDDEAEGSVNADSPDDGLVACPMCATRMKEVLVYAHIDHCTGVQGPDPPTPKPNLLEPKIPLHLSAPSKSHTHQRLPGLQYDLLNDKVLRRKFDDQGIPSWGNRELLKRRYTEWLNLWNAECDSDHPRSKRELLRELDAWERTLGGLARNAATAVNGLGNQKEKKEFDHKAYQAAHKTDFDRLIAQARRKMKEKKSDTEAKKTDAEAQKTNTAEEQPDADGKVSEIKSRGGPHGREPMDLTTGDAPNQQAAAHGDEDSRLLDLHPTAASNAVSAAPSANHHSDPPPSKQPVSEPRMNGL